MTTRSQEFTTPGAITFNVPAGVGAVNATMTGAGGSGGASPAGGVGGRSGLSGGGAGEWCRRVVLLVTPGGTVSGSVGAGGARADYTGTATKGQDGGATTFGPFIALGGLGGQHNDGTGNGTTGGGFGATNPGNWNNTDGAQSVPEYERWNAGASGGGAGSASGTGAGRPGGVCEGQPGGTYGVAGASSAGGSGGGASPWGPGGAGGNGLGVLTAGQGHDAPTTSYGAGGGGSGARPTDSLGVEIAPVAGAGANGYILVEWYEGI